MKASLSLFWFGALAMLICGALYLSSYNGNLPEDICKYALSGIVNFKAAIAMVVLGAFFVLTNSALVINKTVSDRRKELYW